MKRNKRLAALAGRVTGTAYTPQEAPSLDASRDLTINSVLQRTVAHANPQSLATSEGVIPLPDEDELERVRRKRNARRGGGRASTILSDDNRLGG